ncbi:acetyl-CoA carboxylase biotin carboxylase subunit [Lujinxingia litoralis]|uniref:Acetyl-CoA carboxylase biotin carboxylase subunit n=1 Tax=Lujinxingia litoralis TaxID=2211119 RepID=A0A328C7T3_9DELT|nr:acetyl-CoA carboxylase biotin carboxylase subunit [Lujinxingia litoralis]RAL23620.1 acetyl-CoA carboxylase biotin carboxylase subunit [Lujinxingia litoralis]
MFNAVLIANRGEIAARIARTCKRMGIRTVAVYSEADEGAPHTQIADEAYLIGPAHVTKSYLNAERILEVAREAGVDAIHPGYGLLSENAEFVHAVEAAGITFIGPRAEVMELMGDKARAREFAQNAGVPVVPGSDGVVADEDAAIALAETIGYPVLVKASAGGGGIGMNLATNEKKLRKAIKASVRRAESAFGDPSFYLERYIENPRHIEIQVLADHHGNALHLFERECSVQRRHQKVIEEAPSPLVSRHPGLRERMADAALALVRASEYTNAGTVEFIADEAGNFYFIEMNTRLQVEHPVTEMIAGLDLVEWQLRIAAGEELTLAQSELSIDGHAIECRIYAENPEKMFMPAPGTITTWTPPQGEGVRLDSGVMANWAVTPYYDPLIAKLIVHAPDRPQAIARMKAALGEMNIGGLTTNLQMHLELMDDADYLAGDVHTGWLEKR